MQSIGSCTVLHLQCDCNPLILHTSIIVIVSMQSCDDVDIGTVFDSCDSQCVNSVETLDVFYTYMICLRLSLM